MTRGQKKKKKEEKKREKNTQIHIYKLTIIYVYIYIYFPHNGPFPWTTPIDKEATNGVSSTSRFVHKRAAV